MISLSSLQIFDLLFRFAATGQLLLMGIVFCWRYQGLRLFSRLLLLVCICAYILLTTPIEDEHYSWLRQPLLLLTDLTSFSILLLAQVVLNPRLKFKQLTIGLWGPIALWSLFLSYFFLLTPGKGHIHDFNHILAGVVLLLVVYQCLQGYMDDLLDSRRDQRLMLVGGCGIYMLVLIFFELAFQYVKDNSWFSLGNAFLLLLCISFLGVKVLTSKQGSLNSEKEQSKPQVTDDPQIQQLEQLMQTGFYRQPELTIGRLSQELGIPEHQLRRLINQQLGFTNFSHYLNSYRIPAICQQLADVKLKHIPILTLALDMGYGSIASFNRAFKQQMAQTASEYRAQF